MAPVAWQWRGPGNTADAGVGQVGECARLIVMGDKQGHQRQHQQQSSAMIIIVIIIIVMIIIIVVVTASAPLAAAQVRLRLFRGQPMILGRSSDNSLYKKDMARPPPLQYIYIYIYIYIIWQK